MLWDPKKDIKTEVEPLSLEGLVQWLETQDQKTEYKYTQSYDCLWARYMKAIGNEKIEFFMGQFPPKVWEVVRTTDESGVSRWTYGAALKRGKEALARQGK